MSAREPSHTFHRRSSLVKALAVAERNMNFGSSLGALPAATDGSQHLALAYQSRSSISATHMALAIGSARDKSLGAQIEKNPATFNFDMKGMAESEGFEPPIALRRCLISSQVHSTGLCQLSALSKFNRCRPNRHIARRTYGTCGNCTAYRLCTQRHHAPAVNVESWQRMQSRLCGRGEECGQAVGVECTLVLCCVA